tara:strand:+ start:2999 stop:3259 length:261 start_codon:yes stop_codon:yes gene_type:complete
MPNFVLVNKLDEIVDKVSIGDVGKNGAKTYFMGRKQLNENEFDKLWKVMTDDEYDLQFKATLQDRQLGKRKYEWWKDDESWLDIDK